MDREGKIMGNSIIAKGARVLFQGDSITDAGRDRSQPDSLGRGYPQFVAGLYTADHPGDGVVFMNRGISGDRARNLVERWTEDAMDLRPDIVSILIGINDTWRRYDRNDPTSPGAFENGCRIVLNRVKNETDARIVLLEPFVLPVPGDRIAWREDLDPKIEVVRRLATEYGAIFIPLDRIFAELAAGTRPEVWAADGVHPTPAGHAVIARAWLKAVAGE
jgi:lysophospholipase L1-like esterase